MKNLDKIEDNFFEYVQEHIKDTPAALYLTSGSNLSDAERRRAISQIASRQKCASKLSAFLTSPTYLFGSEVAAEQATHQMIALYHRHLAGSGKQILDLTAGQGVDAMSLAVGGNRVVAFELDPERAAALRHNISVLDPGDITLREGDSIIALQQTLCESELEEDKMHADMIFIDPARRDGSNSRTYYLRDCRPDVTKHLPLMLKHSPRVIIKASPIVDIRSAVSELTDVIRIDAVSVRGECKEILITIEKDSKQDDVMIRAIDIDAPIIGWEEFQEGLKPANILSCFDTTLAATGHKNSPIADLSDIHPGVYLYDPNASLHKIDASDEICRRYVGMKRVAADTDLYVNDNLYPNFPGRIILISNLPTSRELKEMKGTRCTVAVRNYPEKAEALRSRLRLREGNERYLYGIRVGIKNKPMIVSGMRCQA